MSLFLRSGLACFLLALISMAGCAPATSSASGAQPPSASPRTTDQRQRWLDMFARGYFPGRSGQVFYVPHEGDFLVDGGTSQFMHGSPYDYDTRIPLLLHGPGFVRPGVITAPAVQQDVAPTLAAILGMAPPATATGRARRDALLDTAERPRVLALFVLDGMRADYFDTYADVMPTLSRLRAEGAWFADMRGNSAPTLTSVGHATLGTGTDPRVHGLVVNNLFNRVTGKPQESYDGIDPGELMALTLADLWNIETNGRAVIIGQGGAIRATVGLVGHGACVINGRRVLAVSYSTRDAGWETNPDCFNSSEALAGLTGERLWREAGGTWMGHDIASPSRFRYSSLFQRFEGEALAAVLEHEPIGADAVTDLVMVNIKGPDYSGHAYGPGSKELRETLAELDRQMARALAIIDRKAGAQGRVVAISADHGMPGEPAGKSRRLLLKEIVAAIDERFPAKPASVVQYFGDPANAQIHLDTAALTARGVSLQDVATFLQSRFFAAVFTEDEVRRAAARLPLGQ